MYLNAAEIFVLNKWVILGFSVLPLWSFIKSVIKGSVVLSVFLFAQLLILVFMNN